MGVIFVSCNFGGIFEDIVRSRIISKGREGLRRWLIRTGVGFMGR